MRKKWVISGLALMLILLLSACNKDLRKMTYYSKKGSIDQRDSAAMYFYEKGNYEKAAFLFEELRSVRRGGDRAEDYLYYYAYCKYKQGFYVSSSYYFEQFTQLYPNSPRSEECSYMMAFCFYNQSDPYYLDQTYTHKALEQFQVFVNLYPGSDKGEEANEIMSQLREKLAEKDFEASKLYLKLDKYKAAVEAFKVLIREYPDSRYREEGQFLLFKSSLFLADKSIHRKKRNRYLDAIDYYLKFIDRYPNSIFLREAESLYVKANRSLERHSPDNSK